MSNSDLAVKRSGNDASSKRGGTQEGSSQARDGKSMQSRDCLPQPLPRPHNVPEPEDRPYLGTVKLSVDATDVFRRIFQVHEVLPVDRPGTFTLLYPEWLPGFHSPKASIESLAGLSIRANGKPLSWRRDPVNVFAFHVKVPEGAAELEITFQYLAPTDSGQERVTMTSHALDLQWNTVLLTPAGYFARNIIVQASATFPTGWQFACAVPGSPAADGSVSFEAAALDVLVDSPVYAGRHFRKIPLCNNVHLNLVADRADLLDATQEQVGLCRRLVKEAIELFGAVHFDRYEFLVALSDEIGANGIEHHRSCEIASKPDLFTEWDKNLTTRKVLAHEFVHSWNGKYRRGADSWQPCFHEPIRNSLMWVYEGLTEYLGQVLCARSGIWTKEDAINSLATVAASQMNRRGRIWRSMSDTTRDPIIAGRKQLPWVSWQRNEDYYTDGQLMWLDVDTIIRTESGGEKSLDDFAKLFFGMNDGDWITNTYEFEDVVRALEEVQPFDWKAYLERELYTLRPTPPVEGLRRAGYDLVFRDTPNEYFASQEAFLKTNDLTHSLGLQLSPDGEVLECVWDSPAFAAAITAGSSIVAVNGRKYTSEEMKSATARTRDGSRVTLLFRQGKEHFERQLSYDGGLRYPHLVPNHDEPMLDSIMASRT